ncbi:MAG: amino acid permease [Gemmatimonadota bacterium]
MTAGRDLVRGLGRVEATSVVIGGIIGASIMLAPSLVARQAGAPGLSLVMWLLGGVIALTGALCIAELSAAMPETGGTYVFLKRAYGGTPIPFLFGWTMFFAYTSSAIAAVATASALYGGYFLERVMPYGTWERRFVAVGLIALITTVNYIGVRQAGKTQAAFTALKLLLIAGVIIVCLGFAAHSGGLTPWFPEADDPKGSLAQAMVLTLFGYSGWHFSTNVAGEIRDPQRNLPFSILVGIAVVIVVYVLVNVSFLLVLPFERLRESQLPATDAVSVAVGAFGAGVVSIAIVASTLGTMNAQLMNYPRIAFAMARDGYFFQKLAHVHGDRSTPTGAIIAQGVVAAAFALSGTFTQILTYTAFVNHTFMSLIVASVFVLRRREPQMERPYRTWGYPVTPLIFLGVSIWYLYGLLRDRLTGSLIGIAIMLLGVPFWLYWRSQRRNRQ